MSTPKLRQPDTAASPSISNENDDSVDSAQGRQAGKRNLRPRKPLHHLGPNFPADPRPSSNELAAGQEGDAAVHASRASARARVGQSARPRKPVATLGSTATDLVATADPAVDSSSLKQASSGPLDPGPAAASPKHAASATDAASC